MVRLQSTMNKEMTEKEIKALYNLYEKLGKDVDAFIKVLAVTRVDAGIKTEIIDKRKKR